jgi:hypothetical protein
MSMRQMIDVVTYRHCYSEALYVDVEGEEPIEST